MAYVIRLESAFASYPAKSFQENRDDPDRSKQAAAQREVWYDIFDGRHRALALQRLVCEVPDKWNGFQWIVTLPSSNSPLSAYRCFARACNEKLETDFVVTQTQYDVLRNLKDDFITLINDLGRDPKATEVAEYYSGGRKGCSSTIRQLAGAR